MGFFNLTKTYSGDIPPRSTTATYTSVSAFRDACYQLVSAFLITYITFSGLLSMDPNTYLAQMGVISIIIVICRIWDGINDPIMGWIIEKFHFKWGKYKPWIFIGALINSAVVLTLFLAHPQGNDGWDYVILFGIFYFLWDIAWTINDIAYWSMLPSLTSDEAKRNNITSIMQIFISIGIFAVYGAVPLLVGNPTAGSDAQQVYGRIAVVVTLLYLISQVVLCIVAKEHVRGQAVEKKEQEDVKFSDMFTLFKKNDQFRINIISIFLNYLASGTLVAFAMYYCYLVFGYGSTKGGSISFMLTVMYAISTLVSQVLYAIFAKKFTRKQIYSIAGLFIIAGYLLFFFTGFPIFGFILAVNMPWLIYIGALLLFFGQGLVSVAIIVQMQSTIEYNELHTGERKEAIVSSMRALVAKWASAVQQGLIYATLAICGLYALTTTISDYENTLHAGLDASEAFEAMETALSSASNPQFIGLGIGMIIVPLILIVLAIFMCTKVFKIDEKKYAEITEQLKARK